MTVLLMLLLAAVPLYAAPPEAPLVFPPRPRLAHTARELADWKVDPSRQGEITQIVSRANAILAKGLTIPEKEGDWIFYYACPKDNARLIAESPERHVCSACKQVYTDERTQASYRTLLNNDLNRDCQTLALAYALTEEERYAVPVKDTLLKLGRLYPTWTRHDRWKRRGVLAVVGGRRFAQLLDEAVSAIELSKAYDLIAQAVPPAEQKDIETHCLGDPVREIMKFQIFAGSRNNHQTWFNAAYVATGLAIGDESLMREGIHGSHGLLWQMEESVTTDGLWYEGTLAYQRYTLMAIVETLEAAARVGWDFSNNARLKSLWFGPLNLAYPNGQLPAFHDSDPANLDGLKDTCRWGYRYFKDPILALYAGVPVADATKPVLKSTDLSGIGIAILRGGTAENPICAMMDYGIHGDHHGHPDKLNIVLYALGRELVFDPGRLSYSVPEYESWTRTTVAHNTVTINGRNQQPDTGKLLYFKDGPDFAAALAVSTGAVPGVVLKRFLVLSGDLLVDVFTTDGRRSNLTDWLLHGRGDLTASLPMVEPKAPIGKDNGYQHLSALREGGGTNAVFTFLPKGDKPHRVYCLESRPSTLFTGEGIGYTLRERAPFLMRRQSARNTVFLTVHDLSGLDRELKIQAEFTGGTDRSPCESVQLAVTTAPAETKRFALDLRDEAAAADRCRIIAP